MVSERRSLWIGDSTAQLVGVRPVAVIIAVLGLILMATCGGGSVAKAASKQVSVLGEAPAVEDVPWGNDPDCTPSPQHPRPVVLLPGTWDGARAFDAAGQRLSSEGFCVYSLTYGIDSESLTGQIFDLNNYSAAMGSHATYNKGAIGDMEKSAEEVEEFIDRVATQTSAGRNAQGVDVVGHSQAGAVIRLVLGRTGSGWVRHVVTLGGTNHGTTMAGISALHPNSIAPLRQAGTYLLGAAPMQQLADSEVVSRLDALPDTVPGVRYTVVVSRGDRVSTPFDAGFLTPVAGSEVDNVVIQDRCGVPESFSHNDLRDDPRSIHLIDNALSGRAASCDGAY